jgi:hypothetical protein
LSFAIRGPMFSKWANIFNPKGHLVDSVRIWRKEASYHTTSLRERLTINIKTLFNTLG